MAQGSTTSIVLRFWPSLSPSSFAALWKLDSKQKKQISLA
jgi:hypothetical protein